MVSCLRISAGHLRQRQVFLGIFVLVLVVTIDIDDPVEYADDLSEPSRKSESFPKHIQAEHEFTGASNELQNDLQLHLVELYKTILQRRWYTESRAVEHGPAVEYPALQLERTS